MRLNTTVVIALVTLIGGIIASKGPIWIPVSVLAAGIIDLLTRSWVASERLGKWAGPSAVLKLGFALIGFYGLIGQFVCIVLIGRWLFT